MEYDASVDPAATPLTWEEQQDLIPGYISTRAELNEAEQANILDAMEWAFRRKRPVLNESFLLGLHKRMFGRVWKWAGQFRKTQKNIGIDHWLVPMELSRLLADARAWVECTSYPPDEIALRFKHRLVAIHPFPNGNGRHSRLCADLLAVSLGREPFSWGSANLTNPTELRLRYITALRLADQHDLAPLIAFARS